MLTTKKWQASLLTLVLTGFVSTTAFGHCEIPCGIYDDGARFVSILEHCQTIEKSMLQILEGSTEDNANQLVRWVGNKEEHASKVQEIVTQYFLTQRIKPSQPEYEKRVTLLHQMLVAAMKCKQTTDVANVETLRTLTGEFKALYQGETAAPKVGGPSAKKVSAE